MKATAMLSAGVSKLATLEEERLAQISVFEERFLSRIKHQREVIARVLYKLNDKNFWKGKEDYCWPEKYQWAIGVGALHVTAFTDQAFEVEVTRKGGAKTSYWVRHDLLFISDWELGKRVRQELAKGLQAQRMEKLRELHQKCQEQTAELEKLSEERSKTYQAWEELRVRTQSSHRATKRPREAMGEQ